MSVDANMRAVTAELGGKMAELSAEIKSLHTELSLFPTFRAMVGTVVLTGATVVTIILAVMAFGGDRFDAGISVGPWANQVDANTRAIEGVGLKVDQVLIELRAGRADLPLAGSNGVPRTPEPEEEVPG